MEEGQKMDRIDAKMGSWVSEILSQDQEHQNIWLKDGETLDRIKSKYSAGGRLNISQVF
jgi:hypothetical protein